MNRPWMPLYVADYLADTMHLRAAEHGAYLLLIMHYWRTGELPADDRQLAQIARMTVADWARSKVVIAAFFDDGWRHNRVDDEIAKANAKHERRQSAGKMGGIASSHAKQKPSNATSNATSNAQASSSESESERKKVPAPDGALETIDVADENPKARLFRIGKPILLSFGIAEKRTGSLIGQWLKARPDPLGLLAALQFARDQNVAEPVAYVSAIIHGKQKNGAANGNDRQPGESLGDLGRRLAAEARKLENQARDRRPDEPFGRD